MQIKKFRSAIARLKKAGLVDPSIDARSVKQTKKLRAAVNRYSDVVAGTAKSIKVARLDSKIKDLKDHNYQIASPRGLPTRVIVPHFPDEKVVAKRGIIEYQSAEGFRRLELPRYDGKKSLKKYFADLVRKKFPDLPPHAKVGARFFNNRTRTYSSVQDLINKISGYESVRKAKSLKAKMDVIRNFEIVITERPREFKQKKFRFRKGKKL